MARLGFGTVRRTKSDRVTRLDRHNLLGIVTLAWAIVVGLTGTINTLVVPITDVWKADQLATIAAPGPIPPLAGRASVQAAVDTAMRAAPGMRPQFVAFPGVTYSSHRQYGVFLQGTTALTAKVLTPAFIDARTGRLDAVRPMPWYMKALLLAQPLHFGDYGGLPMKLLWAALDLLTIAVLVTGLRLWLGRGRGAPAAAGCRGDPRGGGGGLSRRSLRAIFAAPALVAIVCFGGLVAGLLGDGWWDAASWVGLGVPIAIAVWQWRGRVSRKSGSREGAKAQSR